MKNRWAVGWVAVQVINKPAEGVHEITSKFLVILVILRKGGSYSLINDVLE